MALKPHNNKAHKGVIKKCVKGPAATTFNSFSKSFLGSVMPAGLEEKQIPPNGHNKI